jgi:phage tail-like protein
MAFGQMGKRGDPVLGYSFLIALIDTTNALSAALGGISALASGGFSECSGLETGMEVEDYREGGSNGCVLKFPTRVTWTNIRLRRGVAWSDDLWKWHDGFVKGRGKRRDGVIVLLNEERDPAKVWQLSRALPVRWAGPTLNATQSQVAIEELELAHEGMRLLPIGAIQSAAKLLV